MSDSSDEGEAFQLRDYDDDDSEEERPNKRRKMTRQPALRARGLGFVSATTQNEDEDEEAEEDEDPDDARPSMGMGMGMRGFGGAFNIGEYNGEAAARSPSPEVSSGTQTPQTLGRGPSAFGAGGKIQKNSFAARMMAKQGYVEGQGLGKSGQGITAPIQTQMLQSRAGLGHGTEPQRPKKEKSKQTAASQTSTPGASTPRIKAPPKAKYNVTAIESRGLQIPDAMKSIIVDATGAEAKTISSLSGFSTPTSESVPSEAAKASARIKMQLQAYADAWDTAQEQEARYEQEYNQLETSNKLHLSEIQLYQDIISSFERVSMDDSGEARTWDQIIERLGEVQDRFADYIEEFDLPEITAACLEAPLRRSLLDWNPYTDPDYLVSSFQSVGALLELEKSTNLRHRKRTTSFETLLLQHWYPQLRTCLRGWPVYHPEHLTKVFDAWSPILPSWLLYKVLDEIILPKLIEAVRRFPKKIESTPIAGLNIEIDNKKRPAPELHSWLFDWWSLLSDEALDLERFTELRSLVKSKVDGTSWPVWKPLLGSRKAASVQPHGLPPTKRLPPSATNAPAALESNMEDTSFKEIVEVWCAENNLMLRSSGQADGLGRLLYRLQDAERRSKGLLVYFQDDVVFDADGEPYALDETLIGRAVGR